MTPRLKSDFWVNALIRRAQSQMSYATVLRKGDADAGIILIIIRRGPTLTLYQPERDFNGNRVWRMDRVEDQLSLDAKVNRRVDEDPDVWLIEIESESAPELVIGETIIDIMAEDDPNQVAAQALFRAK